MAAFCCSVGLPVQGLAEHKDELGAPLCPCRHYDDKAAEAQQGFWNCPCVPMRERKVHALRLPCKSSPSYSQPDQNMSWPQNIVCLRSSLHVTVGLHGA